MPQVWRAVPLTAFGWQRAVLTSATGQNSWPPPGRIRGRRHHQRLQEVETQKDWRVHDLQTASSRVDHAGKAVVASVARATVPSALATYYLEPDVRQRLRPADPGSRPPTLLLPEPAAQPLPAEVPYEAVDAADALSRQWMVAQAAAVAAAEGIAAEAAADVASEAAVTVRLAADVAAAAASRAAGKAEDVAARAVSAAAAAFGMPAPWPVLPEPELERALPRSPGDPLFPAGEAYSTSGSRKRDAAAAAHAAAATAAARVAMRVAVVAAAAAVAAAEAESLIREQLVKDEYALARQLRCDGGSDLFRSPPGGVVDLLAVTEQLRYGISANQLRLHYQPIMSLLTGQPVGVEALVRWQHSERGLLRPIDFIEVAENSGLVLPLGAWVLHEACRMAVSLQSRNGTPLTVAVNLSGRQLSDRGLVGTVKAALAAAGCGADRLVLEVTETALVTDMDAAVDSLRTLQRLGVGVALDDFGTGYAPLLYLRQLAADDLKIDRSFVSGIGQAAFDTAMVASLISLAHNLNVRCVAEGVETAQQLELLKQLGCDFAQGYLFSRPIDEMSLRTWLDQYPPGEVPAASPPRARSRETARMLSMHSNGASRLTIAAALNAEGSRSPTGRRWSDTTVARTLDLGSDERGFLDHALVGVEADEAPGHQRREPPAGS